MTSIHRGDIWLANLDRTVGSEIQKTRPCVVLSPEEMGYLQTVMVAPMTTGNRPAPFRIDVTFQERQGLILLDQIRTLDKIRLVKKLGILDLTTQLAMLSILREMFEA